MKKEWIVDEEGEKCSPSPECKFRSSSRSVKDLEKRMKKCHESGSSLSPGDGDHYHQFSFSFLLHPLHSPHTLLPLLSRLPESLLNLLWIILGPTLFCLYRLRCVSLVYFIVSLHHSGSSCFLLHFLRPYTRFAFVFSLQCLILQPFGLSYHSYFMLRWTNRN